MQTLWDVEGEAGALLIDLRDSGRAGVRLTSGDHVVAFHFGSGQRKQLVHPYVRAGLQAGEHCVCVVAPGDEPRAEDRQVRQLKPQEIAELDGASAPAARMVTDLAWVARQRPGGVAAYERELERLVDGSGHVALCLWDLEQSDASTIMELLMTHQKVLMGPRLFPSPWFLPPADRISERHAEHSRIDGILALATLMLASSDVFTIGALAKVAVQSIGATRLEGIYLRDEGWQATIGRLRDRELRTRVEARLARLGAAGGPINEPRGRWNWAHPLRSSHGCFGFLIASAGRKPSGRDQFLVRLVAEKVGVALVDARLHERHRVVTHELDHARGALAEATALLDWNTAVRERFRQVVASGGGARDIAFAIHDMTGHTVAVEDHSGTITAWAGPDRSGEPERHPPTPAQRKNLHARALHSERPVWDDDRLVAVAARDNHVVGTVSLIDAVDEVGEGEMMAIEDGATLLTLELHYRRELAEIEARLGQNALSALLEGTQDRAVLARAAALGFDLGVAHRVVLVEASGTVEPDVFFHAVRRAARDNGCGALVVPHDGAVVLLAGPDADGRWERLRAAVVAESGGPCRLGIGKSCQDVTELPGSLRQAMLALKLQDVFGDDRAIEFEQLGIYRLLADVAESSDIERYVKSWLKPLKPLLDYDADNRSELVATLSSFLESGGRPHMAARALNVHRSTLKYRIERIKEISGCDLTDPDTLFNLQLSTRAWQTLSGLQP